MNRWLLLTLISSSLFASPVSHLTKLGEGEMDYLFWTVYQAELYTDNPDFPLSASSSVALRITYFRSIDSDVLINATRDQWKHLGYRDSEISRWSRPLKQFWPDVRSGDTLTFSLQKNGGSRFYLGSNSIGSIEDPEFGHAFLSIWLSEKTSEPELRRKLLGSVDLSGSFLQ